MTSKLVRVVLPAVALLLAAGAGAAHADDSYVGLGTGPGAELDGAISNHFESGASRDSARLMVGKRFGAIALEASAFGTTMIGKSQSFGVGDYVAYSLGLEAKYYVGLAGGLEGYGKLGLNRTWLTGAGDNTIGANYKGRGETIGGGLQYNLNVALSKVSIWADYTIQTTQLRDGVNPDLDGSLTMLTLGASVGF